MADARQFLPKVDYPVLRAPTPYKEEIVEEEKEINLVEQKVQEGLKAVAEEVQEVTPVE